MTDNEQSHENAALADFAEAQAQYQEYYAIRESLDINVVPLPAHYQLPSDDDFATQIPEVFRLASELQVVDPIALSQLRNLGETAKVISDLLNQQNRKLNALLGYLLRSEDEADQRKTAYEYGGAGVGFYSESAYTPGQLIELKLFLSAESAALYSIAEIIQCETNSAAPDASQAYRVTALFRRITDDDRELMVKASLHAQSRLLKKRANERGNKP